MCIGGTYELALTFKLQDFEGPLDLLLHLIEKNKMNIYDIEISSITDQYMEYLEAAQDVELDSMSEFIVMAATLLYIKSRMLLPKPIKENENEEDPREELVRKLIEYKKVKYVSEKLSECQVGGAQLRCFRNTPANVDIPEVKISSEDVLEDVTLKILFDTYEQLLKQVSLKNSKEKEIPIDKKILDKDVYTIEQKSTYIRELIMLEEKTTFYSICNENMPRIEIIVTFMALLELIHNKEIIVEQEEEYGDIFIKENIDG